MKHLGKPITQRQLRVGEMIKKALGTLFIRDEAKIPNLSTKEITVTEVRMSPDLKTAKIFVMPLGGKNVEEVIEKMKEDVYSPSEQIGKYNERFFDIFENLSVNVSDDELERNESVELPSIQDVTSGQILAEDLYTVKDIFFLARNHMIESSDIEKMRIYEDEDNGVRNIWVQSSQE